MAFLDIKCAITNSRPMSAAWGVLVMGAEHSRTASARARLTTLGWGLVAGGGQIAAGGVCRGGCNLEVVACGAGRVWAGVWPAGRGVARLLRGSEVCRGA